MGGLIAADIALLFRHRIIGTINFDVPFVGMHPGIVKAGLGSIFKPWPMPEEAAVEAEADPTSSGKRLSRMNTLFNPRPSDPNFNPTFYNDVHLPVRKGWENTLHWLNKHSNGIVKASKGLVRSHLEFGGAMADYRSLKARYARIRALEEDDEKKRRSANPEVEDPPRIRFANYYTASTGRPKKPKSPKSPSPSRPASRGLQHQDSNTTALTSASQLTLNTTPPDTTPRSPRISVEQHRDNEVVPVTPEMPPSATSPIGELPFGENPVEKDGPHLPEIPPIPQEPPFVDLSLYTDEAQMESAEKEYEQASKEYQQAVKSRNKVIKERSKMQEKFRKQKEKELTRKKVPIHEKKTESAIEPEQLEEDFGVMQLGVTGQSHSQGASPYGNYDFSHSAILNQVDPNEQSHPSSTYTDSTYSLATTDTNASTPGPEGAPKKKRLKKFCMLPPKDAYGNKDPTWIRVFMENIDEVAAHTTLFFMGETYERLVGDVGARIEDWVREAESLRVAREMGGLA